MTLPADTAVYEHTQGRWQATLAGEPQVRATGRTLEQARLRITEAAALWHHVDPADLDLAEQVLIPTDIRTLLQQARHEREEAQAHQASASAMSREAARRLVRELGLSLRDAADLLGLSRQRIQQFLSE